MKPYTKTEPNFSETIEITEVGDPGHADYLNAAPKQLLANTLVNKGEIEELQEKTDGLDTWKNSTQQRLDNWGPTITGHGQIINSLRDSIGNLKPIATSGNYNDLSDKPYIPAAARNGKLTIQRNGIQVQTFTANQSVDTTANIEVPLISNSSAATITGKMALDVVEKNANVQGTLANLIQKENRRVTELRWKLQPIDEAWTRLTDFSKPAYVQHIFALLYAAPGQITLHVSLRLSDLFRWSDENIIIHGGQSVEMDSIIDGSRAVTSFIALMPDGICQDYIVTAQKNGMDIIIEFEGYSAAQYPDNVFELNFGFPCKLEY